MADNEFDKIKLQVREEIIDITKQWEPYAEINWHKEVIREEKNISIPTLREELVIEKRLSNPKSNEQQTEIIRIPIREERVEIIKHTFNVEEVIIDKHQLDQEEILNTSLKKEVPFYKITGNPKVEIKNI
jgi:uncharacterized protein (TIGR02271 family)